MSELCESYGGGSHTRDGRRHHKSLPNRVQEAPTNHHFVVRTSSGLRDN